MFLFHFFTYSCPVFPAPLIEGIVFFPFIWSCLLCHSSIDHRSIDLLLGFLPCFGMYFCFCLRQFCTVLITIALSYSLQSEVREVDCSSSIACSIPGLVPAGWWAGLVSGTNTLEGGFQSGVYQHKGPHGRFNYCQCLVPVSPGWISVASQLSRMLLKISKLV